MFDHRTGTLHDYTRKNGVVAWHHLAPAGAQGWQCDPELFWNKAEAAERRSDSLVARCYRVPVPLGFDEESAVAMALEIAERLRDIIEAPVSLGVHQDSNVDGLGHAKALEKIGYHAHIYLPARGVTALAMAGKKEGIFLDLGNKAHSGQIIERFNQLWAEVANHHAERQLLSPCSDHRSLFRQGINRDPVPTLGVCASALERRGVRTQSGDSLRLLDATDVPVPMSHGNAVRDVQRERLPRQCETSSTYSIEAEDAAFRAEMAKRTDTRAARWRHLDRRAEVLRASLADQECDVVARQAAARDALRAFHTQNAELKQWNYESPKPAFWRLWKRAAWLREFDRLERAADRAKRRRRETAERVTRATMAQLQEVIQKQREELDALVREREGLNALPSESSKARRARSDLRQRFKRERGSGGLPMTGASPLAPIPKRRVP